MGTAPVVIADYSPEWPVVFAVEREALANALRPLAVEIEHIGSTSVPGLGAKPIIDILLGARSLQQIESRIGQQAPRLSVCAGVRERASGTAVISIARP